MFVNFVPYSNLLVGGLNDTFWLQMMPLTWSVILAISFIDLEDWT